MIFPDARERVPLPRLDDETLDVLRRRAYRPAFVENERRPELSFSFLRPPGWEVGPPALTPSAELPLPSLACLSRSAPKAAIEVLLFEASYDVLPGDLLDATLDCLTLPQRSEGLLRDLWYADRMGERPHGYELMAAQRHGKDLFIFLAVMQRDAVQRCRDEVNAIIASFGPKEPRPGPYADPWRMHDDAGLGLSFAVPGEARVSSAQRGAKVSWSIDGGVVELSCRPLGPRERRVDDAEQQLVSEAKRLGAALVTPGRGGDMPAAPGGVLVGDVSIRSYESAPSSKKALEALLLVGTRADGAPLRIAGTWPARTAHRVAWMRARFAFVQLVTTLAATRT